MKNSTDSVLEKGELLLILEILKFLRKKMIEEFINKEPEIFNPSFMYENSNVQLELSIKKYFLAWVNCHMIFLDENNNLNVNEEKFIKLFLHIYRNLMEKIRSDFETKSIDGVFINNIINEEIKYINELLKLGDKTERKMNYLLLEHNKNKVLFDRKIKELKGE